MPFHFNSFFYSVALESVLSLSLSLSSSPPLPSITSVRSYKKAGRAKSALFVSLSLFLFLFPLSRINRSLKMFAFLVRYSFFLFFFQFFDSLACTTLSKKKKKKRRNFVGVGNWKEDTTPLYISRENQRRKGGEERTRRWSRGDAARFGARHLRDRPKSGLHKSSRWLVAEESRESLWQRRAILSSREDGCI